MCNLSTPALSLAFTFSLALAGPSMSSNRLSLAASKCTVAILQAHVALMGFAARALLGTLIVVESVADLDTFDIVSVKTIFICFRTSARPSICSLFDLRRLEFGSRPSVGARRASRSNSCERHPSSGQVIRWRRCNWAIALHVVLNTAILRVDFVARGFHPLFPVSGCVLRCLVDCFTKAVIPGRFGVEVVKVFRHK